MANSNAFKVNSRNGSDDEMYLEGSWEDLKTKGYLIIRNVFSAEQLKVQQKAYYESPRTNTKLYGSRAVHPDILSQFMPRLTKCLQDIRARAGIKVSRFSDGIYFATKKTQLSWHIDYQVFYIFQNCYDSVNFWMPIKKANPKRSGLSVIPLDQLEKNDPAIFRGTLGNGAAGIFDGNVVVYENQGEEIETKMTCSPDEIAFTPDLNAGDVFVVRRSE